MKKIMMEVIWTKNCIYVLKSWSVFLCMKFIINIKII